MKTNPAARNGRKFRMALFCLAIVSLAGLEFRLGESLASRFGQDTTCRSESPQAPSMGISDLMGVIR